MNIVIVKRVLTQAMRAQGPLLWALTVACLLWLSHLPLTPSAQQTLVMSLLAVLFTIGFSMSRMETHLATQVKFFRILAIFLAGFISLRYFSWRFNHTISYHDPFSMVAAILLVGAEIYGLVIYLVGAFVNCWPIHREPPPLPENPDELPTVDILIPTYNEDEELLELTLLAATQIQYPKHRFKVYLCDDGGSVQRRNRPDISEQSWARFHSLNALCKKVGAHYVTRERNVHAKAGNMNSALQDHCTGDLVLILDADHIPTVDILKNTVGFFLKDPKLFLVQTPHYFINPDPIERNLRTYDRMPSENEMFYNLIQHGLDFWNASFFCGSAALLRRKYIDEIGGVAGETITEDAETAMTLHGLGYHSVYYGKPMIAGLQPETFSGFIVQRSRWAQGMVQIFLLKNPWSQPKMSIQQRVAYTSSVFFWFFPLARVVFFVAPALYLLFSLKIMDAFLPTDLISYALPHVLAAMTLSNILYGRTRWPLISEVYETIQSMHAAPAIIEVLRAPRSPSFAVTPKGERLDENFISQLALPFYLMLVLGVICLMAGVVRLYYVPDDIGVITLTMVLTVYNMVFSLACIGVMLEKAQKRLAYRMPSSTINLSATLCRADGQRLPVMVDDISHSGAGLFAEEGLPRQSEVRLEVAVPAWNGRVVEIPAKIMRTRFLSPRRWELGLMFDAQTQEEKRAVIALVYGDSNLHVANQRRRQHRIGLLQGLSFLMTTAFSHAKENMVFLTRLFFTRLSQKLTGWFEPARPN